MKKSVLFVTPYFYPRLGGVETHVYQLAKVLISRGWHVSILTQHLETSTKKLDLKLQLHHIKIDDNMDKRAVWKAVEPYSKEFTKFDVIHVHDVGWWLLPWLFRIRDKTFITFHGWEGTFPIPWQSKLHRKFLSMLTAGSIHVGGYISEFYWDKPTYTIYGGTELVTKAKRPVLSTKKPHFIFVGRLEQENAIEMYLEFFNYLKLKNISPKIIWVGDGSYRPLCEQVGNVTGMVSDVTKYLNSADFVCANSYLSILDAQAAGKVVCSLYQHELKKRYLETYPGSESMLVSGAANELATKVIEILNDKEAYINTVKSAIEQASKNSWLAVADVYEELWNKNS